MNPRELFLLTPYRLPAQNSVTLGHDDVASFLNGHAALWHPSVLLGATGPPQIASSYDHEQPRPGHVYAVPESPTLLLPDDWFQRVADVGAIAFRATTDRATTFANLRAEIDAFTSRQTGEPIARPFGSWPEDANRVGPFLGIGYGVLVLNTLFEAMEHENMVPVSDLWQDIQQALAAIENPDFEAFLQPLRSAAGRLTYARDVLYPSPIYVIDLVLLDEDRLADPFPAAFAHNQPINVIASVAALERLGREHPERLAVVKDRFQKEEIELCSGCYLDREDALLPPESYLWNLFRGRRSFEDLFGAAPRVFGRKRFGGLPQQPMLLTHTGLTKMVNLPFDNGVLPSYRTPVTSWPAPSGKSVDAFTRAPVAADNPLTFFHLAHYLYKTIRNDSTATVALVHKDGKPATGYEDWLELTRFGPILGRWTPLSRYFGEAVPGEYASSSPADDFHSDHLEERTTSKVPHPVGGFADHVRRRRRLDVAWVMASMYRGLAGKGDQLRIDDRLPALEDLLEAGPSAEAERELSELQSKAASALADRLVAGATSNQAGFLAFNPCSFTRRVALEVEGITKSLPAEGAVKACQVDGNLAKLVVELPPLGFVWFPQSASGSAAASKLKMADNTGVRNEFFEAEVDGLTGGLKALRDLKTKLNRIGQQLVFNPGSKMRMKELKVVSTGPAVGEVVSIGSVLGEQDQLLANYRQRYRAWAGRPVLDLQIEIQPIQPPAGYPWHAYYGARFAWGDERALLLRGVYGINAVTAQTRPESSMFLDLRTGKQSTTIFTYGLPFHQRQGTRMLDVILVPEGETTQTFDLALGLDREHPALTALSLTTPVPVVPTSKGPPHIGPVGWLFHLDALNLLMTSLRPLPNGGDGLTLRVLESSTHGGAAEFRCVRDPKQATLTDGRGNPTYEAGANGDGVVFEVPASDLAELRIEFS
jgi:hypothetical protein